MRRMKVSARTFRKREQVATIVSDAAHLLNQQHGVLQRVEENQQLVGKRWVVVHMQLDSQHWPVSLNHTGAASKGGELAALHVEVREPQRLVREQIVQPEHRESGRRRRRLVAPHCSHPVALERGGVAHARVRRSRGRDDRDRAVAQPPHAGAYVREEWLELARDALDVDFERIDGVDEAGGLRLGVHAGPLAAVGAGIDHRPSRHLSLGEQAEDDRVEQQLGGGRRANH
mmetsp:Transcript_22359/g.53659  ORF Transcript_22359/g.53659 Transcript_22359/m.53659 type:complete len:230 (-) Transcript_22359:35-724(-)